VTAIAYRNGVMAADTETMSGETLGGNTRKIERSPAGTIGAAAGEAGMAYQFRRWLRDGRIDKWIEGGFPEALPTAAERDRFGAIIVTAVGRVICVDYRGNAVEFDAPFYTEGSAGVLLVGAMAAGASAEEAVRIAIRHDAWCGGDVQVERLEQTGVLPRSKLEPKMPAGAGVPRGRAA
jgi:hypothetical protein